MPRPQTLSDSEVRCKIADYVLETTKFPTISWVKKLGVGDSRAQSLLAEVKGEVSQARTRNACSQPQPQPQPQPRPESGPSPALDISESMVVVITNKTQWVDISKLPAWLTKRVLNYLSKEVKT